MEVAMTDGATEGQIWWPDEFLPEKTQVHVSNRARINAPPEVVWAWLVRAVCWPEWYCNSDKVRFVNQEGSDLKKGTRFRWKTFGVNLKSEVKEFVPVQRLAWDARCFGVAAYHAWLIMPVEGGCEVLTEENQHGWLARLGRRFRPGRMERFHQAWLYALSCKAQEGLP
jgi:Polyketide cyclase / dehydrase and lipid transport